MEGILIKLSKEIRETKKLFDTRFTAARAKKIDNLNASITSRAAQSTVDDIKSRVIDIRKVWSSFGWRITETHASTKALTNSPASGKIVKFRRNWKTNVGIKNISVANVSGSGVLRFVKDLVVEHSHNKSCKINIDGKIIDLLDTEHAEAFFSKGIRFKRYCKITIDYKFVGDSRQHHEVRLSYGYTLGD